MENTWKSLPVADQEDQQLPPQQPASVYLGMAAFSQYSSTLKKIINSPNFSISILPSQNFRMKFVLEKEGAVLSSNVYKLSLKHDNRQLLYCSKQIFGKYVFYYKDENQSIIERAYMSKYQNQYKLYLKQNNDKYELAYFTDCSQSDKQKKQQKFKIVLPINQNLTSQLQGIKSNVKKQSEIKWRWCSKSDKVQALNIEKVKGNLLRLMYIYVSKGDTINDTKMVMREMESNVWEYFIENPLTIIQGFALSVLMAENSYT